MVIFMTNKKFKKLIEEKVTEELAPIKQRLLSIEAKFLGNSASQPMTRDKLSKWMYGKEAVGDK